MDSPHGNWRKTVFWGAITAALYAAMFYYADFILHLTHTTPESCVVGSGVQATYLHHVDVLACTAMGGHIEPGTWWHVLPLILIAFAVSYTHGAFTGLFWEMMGLKPATRK